MRAALAVATWPEVQSREAAILIVPLGSTEQHGPHLPLSTDTDIALRLARAAAERLEGAVVAPVLPFGSSGEHQDFPGTLSIGREALELVLVELCRSASVSFRQIVLVNAHGGNADPVAAAIARLRGEWREVMAWSPRWGGDLHAGRAETSLMLALRPRRVRRERAVAGNTAPLAELMPALREGGVGAVAANGVLGDPAGASEEEGWDLFDAAVADLVAAVAAWTPAEGTPPRPVAAARRGDRPEGSG